MPPGFAFSVVSQNLPPRPSHGKQVPSKASARGHSSPPGSTQGTQLTSRASATGHRSPPGPSYRTQLTSRAPATAEYPKSLFFSVFYVSLWGIHLGELATHHPVAGNPALAPLQSPGKMSRVLSGYSPWRLTCSQSTVIGRAQPPPGTGICRVVQRKAPQIGLKGTTQSLCLMN